MDVSALVHALEITGKYVRYNYFKPTFLQFNCELTKKRGVQYVKATV